MLLLELIEFALDFVDQLEELTPVPHWPKFERVFANSYDFAVEVLDTLSRNCNFEVFLMQNVDLVRQHSCVVPSYLLFFDFDDFFLEFESRVKYERFLDRRHSIAP